MTLSIPNAHPGEVLCLASFGSHVWSGGLDQAIRVWESSTLELLHTLDGSHTDGICGLISWSARNRCLAWSSSLDSSLCVWETLYKTLSK